MDINISLEMICDKLTNYNAQTSIIHAADQPIKMVKMIAENQVFYEPDILYVGAESDLPEIILEGRCINFLCVDSRMSSSKYENCKNLNILALNSDEDRIRVFDELQDIIALYQQWISKLLDCLVMDHGLQRIIETGHELISNQVIVHDIGYRLLAYSEPVSEFAPLWDETKLKGYLSLKLMSIMKKEKLIFIEDNNKSSILLEKGLMGFERIGAPITLQNKLIAQIVVFDNQKPFNKSDLELVNILSKIVACEMQKNAYFFNSSESVYENFIIEMLEGKTYRSHDIKERFKSLNLRLEEYLYVLTISFNELEALNIPILYFKNLIEDTFPGYKPIVYKNNIVLLIGRDRKDILTKENLEPLANILKQADMVAGLSRCFHNMKDIRGHYQQSLKALELSKHQDGREVIFFYEDYVLDHILEMCSPDKNLRDFCHPAIFTLMDYDRQHRTSYVRTLYEYLANTLDLSKTADVLKIQRNSLKYRIDKVQKIINIELNNSKLLFHFYLSFRILEFLSDHDFISILGA